MCVDWITYILLYVNWNWIELYVIVENGELEMNIDSVFAMWIVIEKWWFESEYDELLEIEWLVDNWLICVCGWEWYECGICWVEKWDENWDVELLMMKEWFELLRLWIWNLLNWIELMNYVNCLCLMVMSWLFKWLINMW